MKLITQSAVGVDKAVLLQQGYIVYIWSIHCHLLRLSKL